jgi:methionine salvage enolase-phosphatase E1
LGISLTTNLKESNITDSFGIKLYFTSSRSVNGQEMYFMQTTDLDIGKKLGGIYIANTDIEIK